MSGHICDGCRHRSTEVRVYHRTDAYGTLYSNGEIARVGCSASKRNPHTVREVPEGSCEDYRPKRGLPWI